MAIIENWPAGLDFSGKLDDLVFYTREGKKLVRTKGSLCKEKIRRSKAFTGTRRAQRKFGLASRLSKDIRSSLGGYLQEWKTSGSHNQLIQALMKMIMQSEADKEQRYFDPHKLHELEGVGFDSSRALLVASRNVRLDKAKGSAYLRIGYGKLQKMFGSVPLPCRVVFGIIALSGAPVGKPVKLSHKDWHGKAAFNEKKKITKWPERGELRLKVSLKAKEELPEEVGLLAVIGVREA